MNSFYDVPDRNDIDPDYRPPWEYEEIIDNLEINLRSTEKQLEALQNEFDDVIELLRALYKCDSILLIKDEIEKIIKKY